jgi:hypothetical protein
MHFQPSLGAVYRDWDAGRSWLGQPKVKSIREGRGSMASIDSSRRIVRLTETLFKQLFNSEFFFVAIPAVLHPRY